MISFFVGSQIFSFIAGTQVNTNGLNEALTAYLQDGTPFDLMTYITVFGLVCFIIDGLFEMAAIVFLVFAIIFTVKANREARTINASRNNANPNINYDYIDNTVYQDAEIDKMEHEIESLKDQIDELKKGNDDTKDDIFK